MARAIQLLRKGIQNESERIIGRQIRNSMGQTQKRSSSYVTHMRKSTIDANMLRLLRNEIHYELDRSPPQQEFANWQPDDMINGFKVAVRPGEQWISLEKGFGEKELIKVEVTMLNGSAPSPGLPDQKIQLHSSMIVSIFNSNSNKVLELICSAWPDSIAISRLFVRPKAKLPHRPYYSGPKFRELDDELQDSLFDFLEERGIDDSLCAFLHNYLLFKQSSEYIRWIKSVKSFMEK